MSMTVSSVGKVSAKCVFDDGYVEGWSQCEISEVSVRADDPYVLIRLYEPDWESLSAKGWCVWAKIRPTEDGYGKVELWNDSFKNEIERPMEWFVGTMEQNIFALSGYMNKLKDLGVVGSYAGLSDDGFKTHPGGGGGLSDATLKIAASGAMTLVGMHQPNWDISDHAKKITATGTLLPSGIGYVMATDSSERYCYFAAITVDPDPDGRVPDITISSWVIGKEYFGRWVDGYEDGPCGNQP
jgi:hypothetical protein